MTEHRLGALNLFYVLQRLTLGNINSCEVFELAGRLDHARLRKALAAVCDRHPALNSTLVERGWRTWWTVEAPSPSPLPLDVRVASLDTDDPARVHAALLANVWQEGFDLSRSRQIRVHVTETPARTWLQLVTARLYNDARAGYLLAHELASAYTALEEGAASPDTTRRGFSSADIAVARPLRHALGALRCFASDLLHRDVDLPIPRVEIGPRDFAKIDLGEELLVHMRARAKQLGVTVHALLLLAMVHVWRDTAPPGARRPGAVLRVLDNFDLRRFARAPADGVYETMVVPYTLRLPTEGSDEEILRSAAGQLERWKQGAILDELYRSRLYAALGRVSPIRWSSKLVARFVAKSNIVLSNPGPIPYPLERFGSVPITDFYNFSQLFPPNQAMLIFSTFRGHLRAVAVHDTHALPEGTLTAIVAPLRAHLERLCAGARAA